jgi:hypothetical protein
MWFYSPALLLSGCLGLSVRELEMYKVKVILQWQFVDHLQSPLPYLLIYLLGYI